MAGYNDTGTTRKEYDPDSARAYCEGFYDRSQSITLPAPYDDTPNVREAAAYHQGAADCAALEGQTLTKDDIGHCAIPLVEVPVQP